MKVTGLPSFFRRSGGPSQVWPSTTSFCMKPLIWPSASFQNCLIQGLCSIANLVMPSQRSEEHTSELQSLMRISYAVFCLKKKKHMNVHCTHHTTTIHLYNTALYERTNKTLH